MDKIGEAVHVIIRFQSGVPYGTRSGLVLRLAPLVIAVKLEDQLWGTVTEPPSEDVTFLGRMFVETKEEALTHRDWYIRNVIAARLD